MALAISIFIMNISHDLGRKPSGLYDYPMPSPMFSIKGRRILHLQDSSAQQSIMHQISNRRRIGTKVSTPALCRSP
jgi:hypothetical protein